MHYGQDSTGIPTLVFLVYLGDNCMDNYWNFGIGQNTEAHVHVVEISLFILTIQQNVSLFFSVVRAHLAEQHDLFGHTRPIGRRLSIAALDK